MPMYRFVEGRTFWTDWKCHLLISQVTLNSEMAAVCFEDYYSVTTTQDCIIGPPFTIRSLKEFLSPSADLIAIRNRNFPSISQSLVCFNRLRIKYQGNVSASQCWGLHIFYKAREKLLILTILFFIEFYRLFIVWVWISCKNFRQRFDSFCEYKYTNMFMRNKWSWVFSHLL